MDDLGLTEGLEALHEGDTDLDFGRLAGGVSSGDAFNDGFRHRIVASVPLRT